MSVAPSWQAELSHDTFGDHSRQAFERLREAGLIGRELTEYGGGRITRFDSDSEKHVIVRVSKIDPDQREALLKTLKALFPEYPEFRLYVKGCCQMNCCRGCLTGANRSALKATFVTSPEESDPFAKFY